MATNISHWLKVQTREFKNDIFAKKCILISFWIFNIAFIIPSHFIVVPYFTLWMLDFFVIIRVSNSLDPDQAQHFVVPDLGQNCLQRLSADIASKELNTKQLVDTFWLKPWLKLISFGSNFFHLAKVLATTNSEPGLALYLHYFYKKYSPPAPPCPLCGFVMLNPTPIMPDKIVILPFALLLVD